MPRRDEERLAEEQAGSERPKRPRSLSGTYLEQAVEALQTAADPVALYGQWRERPPVHKTAEAVMTVNATRVHQAACRNGVLFAALAAEAYVNEFLGAHLSGRDLEAVDRMRTVDKYVLGTKLAYGESLFFRDREGIPELVELFNLRNRLVHPRPGFGPSRVVEAPSDFAQLFAPPRLAHFIVMVSGCASVLMRRTYGMQTLDFPADLIWQGSKVLYRYAETAQTLPARDAPSPSPLFTQIIEAIRGTKKTHPKRKKAPPRKKSPPTPG